MSLSMLGATQKYIQLNMKEIKNIHSHKIFIMVFRKCHKIFNTSNRTKLQIFYITKYLWFVIVLSSKHVLIGKTLSNPES